MRFFSLSLDIGALLLAVVCAVVGPPLRFLDGAYANGFYPAVQNAVTSWTNRVPFAVADVLMLAILAALATHWSRAVRASPRWPTALHLVVRTLAVGAVLYVWFLVAWGWNYSRPSLATVLGATTSIERAQLEPIELHMVDALNAAAGRAHRRHELDPDSEAALAAAEENTLVPIGVVHPVVRTRPKRTILDPYFNATGVSGMFMPFTFETYVASDVLWFEYPFTLEHEWGHVAGIARESDANFIAALATLSSPDDVLQYSGLLIVYAAMPRIPQADARLSPLVRSDYAAMRTRDRRHIQPIAFKLAWRSYDTYLKAQHVSSGVVNYTEYIRLLLGTDAGRAALAKAVPALRQSFARPSPPASASRRGA